MRDTDPRIHELFIHLRQALDALEQIMLRPHWPTTEPRQEAAKRAPAAPSIPADEPKLAYTVKEVRKLVGISTATLYKVFGRRELRTVKVGGRTLILATDLQEWVDNLPSGRRRL
jgi:excisionase family DNA binding protein